MNEDGDDKYWWKLSYLTSKWSKNENPEKSRNFFLNPGIKNIGKSRPEKSRDPGIWQNPVPKNPGIEILDPVRACPQGNTTAPSLPEKQWRGSFYKGPFLQPVHRTFKGMRRLPRVIKGDLQTSTLGWYWKREVDPPNLYQLFLCSFWSTIWENTWVFVIWVIFEAFVIFYTLSRF